MLTLRNFTQSRCCYLIPRIGANYLSHSTFADTSENKASYFHKISNRPIKYQNIGQILKEASIKYCNREALVSCSENSKITFSETLDKVDRLASGLLNLGLSRGDCVAIWASNYEFWYISSLAIARAGLICVSLNPAYQIPELDYCLKKVNVKVIIAAESFRKQKHYEMLSTLLPNLKHSKGGVIENKENSVRHVIIHSDKKLPGVISFNEILSSSSENDVIEVEKIQSKISPDSACNIQFSSGTTGQPKAAAISHLSMINNGYDLGIRQAMHQNYRRICLNNPFFHAYGLVIAMMNALNHGSTLVLPAPHFDPKQSLMAIKKEKCDVIYGTPTMFVDLVTAQRELNLDLPDVAIATTGGAICTPKLVQDIEKVLKAKKIVSIYGLSETTAGVFMSLPNDDNKNVQTFVGHVMDHLETKVVDSEGNAVRFGEPGELYVRGYSTMLRYWDDQLKTKEIMGDDKLKTGDQFILYENGYGKIVGRLKEMIIRGGENLYPREIEDFLNSHPDIIETHVIGIPDERLGEEVAAFIRVKDNSTHVTQNDIKEFCSGKLAHFKVPRFVIIVDEFPRTVSGKHLHS
ncbi:CLUMA_CG007913, isoform A [Clunio marinus]|uniref:Medium-chain acyl-CoA ligase ACSF2, mitochondrial n=1 Tax=Clunio marinus TaxID=568069 RepID=A0A1J1I638_9DIPT|nr:CLUMA_CG007913, isoform A [Clunio marinus]